MKHGELTIDNVDAACSSKLRAVHAQAAVRMGRLSRDGGNKKDTVRDRGVLVFAVTDEVLSMFLHRIRILTEIEPEW